MIYMSTREIHSGQVVIYEGRSGMNGLYVVTDVVEIGGETRYNMRSVPRHINRRGVTVDGPRYRHNGVGPAQPVRLSHVGIDSVCVISGMTVDSINEVEV